MWIHGDRFNLDQLSCSDLLSVWELVETIQVS